MIKVSDLLGLTLKYINEYGADVQEDVQTGEVDAFGKEAEEDLLAHIDAAARMVAQVAPANTQTAKTITLTPSPSSGSGGSVEDPATEENTFTLTERPDKRRVMQAQLPADYMRLIYLLYDSLYRPITVLLPATHPTYAMQYCPIAGIGAGAYAPIGYQVDGTLEVHSIDPVLPSLEEENVNDNEGVTFVYLALPKVEKTAADEYAGVPANTDVYKTLKDELKDVVAMQAAALYLSMNDNEKAALAQRAVSAMLNQIVQEAIDGE